MTLYDEYCYNLMEAAITAGVQGKGLTKDECVAYANMLYGVRELERYIKEHEPKQESYADHIMRAINGRTTATDANDTTENKESEDTEDGKEMGD